MKKTRLLILVTCIVCIFAVGCSKEKKDKRTLQDFISAYTDQNIDIDVNEKPIYQLIGATDGVIFYIDNSPVKIYEYENISSLKKAKDKNSMMKDWEVNGKFLLEARNEQAKDIFESVE